MKTGMHYGASSNIFDHAKSLRKNQTFSEKLLWSRIRNKQLGYHFRRQHPISTYIVDFYCHELSLVIEVDGSIHAERLVALEDKSKSESLSSYGLHVIRFTNEAVKKDIESVIFSLKNVIIKIAQDNMSNELQNEG